MKFLQCIFVSMVLCLSAVFSKTVYKTSWAVYNCPVTHFRCSNGEKCIPINWKCDGKTDCEDASDEPEGKCSDYDCEDGYMKCKSGDQCFYHKSMCNGHADCVDESDEDREFCEETDCHEGDIRCPGGGQCIPKEWMCDNIDDCYDKSDITMKSDFCKEK